MPEDQVTQTSAVSAPKSKLNIPEETRAQFPDLTLLIAESPSMNDEERQYWIDVLPIMTEDQLTNLRDILGTEKRQISDANQAYGKGVEMAKTKVSIDFNEASYRAKKRAIKEAERAHETQEKAEEEAVLKEIEGMTA